MSAPRPDSDCRKRILIDVRGDGYAMTDAASSDGEAKGKRRKFC